MPSLGCWRHNDPWALATFFCASPRSKKRGLCSKNGEEYIASRWSFQIFFLFTPTWGNDPIWLAHIFQMGWFNHQLGIIIKEQLSNKDINTYKHNGWRNTNESLTSISFHYGGQSCFGLIFLLLGVFQCHREDRCIWPLQKDPEGLETWRWCFFEGAVLRIRSHGIHHHFAPPFGDFFLFFPTTLSKSKKRKRLNFRREYY